MNKPPIKQKPLLKPKPPIKPIDLENSNKINFKDDFKPIDELKGNKKLNKSNDNILDKNQLTKAYQLLNQKNNLSQDKEDIKYDIRVDEDQIESCNQIITNLFNAGYLRANIIGLSEFDKIIGGMCWCIELCNIDIDIDLFYQDSLTIGQKISLTEKIVKVLNLIKCPFPLEPHQIQGLDCINILPVIQWLIKESREFSLQIKDYLDMFANYRFNCDHGNLNSNKEELVISRSKEAKKIIKEYFNKNEIKINLEYKIEEYSNELEKIEKLDNQLMKDNEELDNEFKIKKDELINLDNKYAELANQLKEHQTIEKKELALEYSKLIDNLKQLKSTNKQTKQSMKKDYELLLNSKFEIDNDLEHQLEFETKKLNKLKSKLVDKNKNYLVLRRKYDNILSNEEMNQYQKRFIELSAQVANKLNETKKFYILYNQLDSTKKQMENKFQFFESLLKCFNQLNSSDTQMIQQFIAQIEQKITSLNTTLVSIKNRNQTDLQRKQILEKQWVELVEMKRLYYKYVKELKEEINRKSN